MRYDQAKTWEVLSSLEEGPARTRARERALALYRETGAAADARRIESALTGQ
jgi:hypothetical protein